MAYRGMESRIPDFNFPEDFYLDDVGVWRLKKEKIAELENPSPQTNEAWLRSCNTEQLAEWLQEHMDCASCGCNKGLCYQGYDCCKLAFVEWLKEVHHE